MAAVILIQYFKYFVLDYKFISKVNSYARVYRLNTTILSDIYIYIYQLHVSALMAIVRLDNDIR